MNASFLQVYLQKPFGIAWKGHLELIQQRLTQVLIAGRDHCVVLWSIEDHVTSMHNQHPSRSGTPTGGTRQALNTGGSPTDISTATSVFPRGIFQGHTDTVEDVQFRPSRYPSYKVDYSSIFFEGTGFGFLPRTTCKWSGVWQYCRSRIFKELNLKGSSG